MCDFLPPCLPCKEHIVFPPIKTHWHPSCPHYSTSSLTVSLLAEIPQGFIGNNLDFNYILFIRVHAWLICMILAFLAVQPCAMKKAWTGVRKTSLMNSASNSSMFSFASIHHTVPAHHEYLVYMIDKWMNEEKQKRKYGGVYYQKGACQLTFNNCSL